MEKSKSSVNTIEMLIETFEQLLYALEDLPQKSNVEIHSLFAIKCLLNAYYLQREYSDFEIKDYEAEKLEILELCAGFSTLVKGTLKFQLEKIEKLNKFDNIISESENIILINELVKILETTVISLENTPNKRSCEYDTLAALNMLLSGYHMGIPILDICSEIDVILMAIGGLKIKDKIALKSELENFIISSEIDMNLLNLEKNHILTPEMVYSETLNELNVLMRIYVPIGCDDPSFYLESFRMPAITGTPFTDLLRKAVRLQLKKIGTYHE